MPAKDYYHNRVKTALVKDNWIITWDGIEDGMATELLAAGIPKEKIVLGWKSPQLRKLTEFAVS